MAKRGTPAARIAGVRVIAILVCCAGVARADVPRCSQGNADLSYVVTDLPELSGDTGWFPDGYSAQLRLTGQIAGETLVAMGLSPTACWDGNAMRVTAPGRAQTGLLDSEYGAALHVYGQIHTSVLGYQIDWSGEIPTGFLPTNLLLAGTTTFDPAALAAPVSVTSPPTSPVIVLSTDLLSAVIDVTGISGGLDIAVQGDLTTAYQTTSIALGSGSIADPEGSIAIDPPFGTSLVLPVSASGVVHYEPSLIFSVLFDVRIFGVRVVSYSLASVTLPLPTIDRSIALVGDDVTIPLPHMSPVPSGLGFASGAVQQLKIHNAGLAPLAVELASAPPGVIAQAATIAPGSDGVVQVSAVDPAAVASAPLVLATNDPNYGQLSIALDPASSGETTTGGEEHSGGCSTGGGSPLVLLALALIIGRRRMR